jgi:hypothetical protein
MSQQLLALGLEQRDTGMPVHRATIDAICSLSTSS